MKNLFVTGRLTAALAFLLLISAGSALADDVKITSTDNYAGNQQPAVEGIVVPDNVYDRQPFSFAVPQVIEGEVVSIQTVSGEVVQRSKSDKYGRVFLAAGLPAGVYLISRGEGRPIQSLGKIEIKQAYVDPWAWMGTDGWVPIPIDPICVAPPAVKLNDSFALAGRGFSPNFSDMQVSFAEAGQVQNVPVLAATADQLKLAPVTQLPPGTAEMKITNQTTGRSARPGQVLLYDLQGHLERNKLSSGEQTMFVLNTRPADVPITVRASISGKATFSGGHDHAEAVSENGRAVFPVQAKHGSGDFHISWEGQPLQPAPGAAGNSTVAMANIPGTGNIAPTGRASSKGAKAACACGCGGSAQPRCAFKSCGCGGSAKR